MNEIYDAHSILTGPNYDVNAHIRSVRALHDAYPLKGNEATHQHTIQLMSRITKRLPTMPAEHMLELVYGSIAQLFEKEGVYDPVFWIHENKEHPPTTFRPQLLAMERSLSDHYRRQAENAVVEMMVRYLEHAPAGAYVEEGGTTSIPFYEGVDTSAWVSMLMGDAFKEEDGKPLFPRTDEQVRTNLCEASGTFYDSVKRAGASGKYIFPKDSKLDDQALVIAYLKDTIFHAMLVAPMPFAIPPNTRFSGQWVLAPPNRGKTNLLLSQIEQDVKENASILLMDSKGDLINPLRSMASIKDRLVVLEPSLEYPLAINPLDLGASTTHTVSFIEYVFSSLLESEPTALQNTLFRSVLLLLREKQDATFTDFRTILTKGLAGYESYVAKMDEEDQEFFRGMGSGTNKSEFESDTYKATKTQLLWRIRDLTTRIPLLRAMFRAPKTRIDMGKLMDSGKIVVLDVRKQLLGDEGSEFLGRLYIAMVRAAADQRASRRQADKLPCYFYIDEAHTIISEDTKLAGIIQECRSQNIAMILAHQAISQISNQITLGALSDCAIRMANSDEETSQLASRLRATPDMLRSLPIGTFATFVRDTTRQAVRLRIPLSGVPSAPQMTRAEQDALQARMRAQYAYRKDQQEPPVVVGSAPAASSLADALKSFAAEKPAAPPSTPTEPEADRW
jgi:hypothetical protein